MNAAPAVVLFDLDGVLAHYAHAPRLRHLAQHCGCRDDEVHAALFESGLENDADLGLYDDGAQVEELARRLGRPVTLEACVEARRASMQADPEVLAIAEAVARRARVAILTNNNLLLQRHLPRICPPLFPLFEDAVYCSAQFRAAKPDPAVFAACLSALGADPGEVLFVDDKAASAEAAVRAGMRGHHFTSARALRLELQRLGLLESAT
ncbi:HAD family hydrolase [Cognatiluteimonas lumbrici]|uniref:HAD family hydrolase n=1 Tax=Cognatiluteimonas lumbrici TaxID=2559601 RepID=UPI001128C780|nr:HAD family phosphatase [Luteimonas lumbrici]